MKKVFITFLTFFFFLRFVNTFSEEKNTAPEQEIGFVEKLGQIIPLDITLIDEFGKTVILKELINNKPVILSLVYYRCPAICSPLLNGLAETVNKLDLEPSKDFQILTVSFDPNEDYILASEKKKNYFNLLKNKQMQQSGWRFLTADSVNISRITQAVGFRFKKEGNDFAHGAGLTIISPEGKIVRYLYGIDFLPFDMKMSLVEASEGRVGTTIAKVMKFCFSYDPEGRRYALNITRVAGGGIIFLLLVFVIILTVKKPKTIIKTGQKEQKPE